MAKQERGADVADLNDNRHNTDNMLLSMYQERVGEDTRAGNLNLHKRNPDARTLYAKGVFDVLNCMQVWRDMNLDPEQFGHFLECLHKQSAEAAAAVLAH